MADFKTHVTFSSVLGCGYAAAGAIAQVPLETAVVAGGLCGVSGMLPDVDSDSGVPRREAMGFAAAIVPMLLLDRFDQMDFERDQIILAGAALYFLIRFQASKLIGKFSVHRGMWHSIPAVLIFAGIAFLISGPADNLAIRYFKAFAVGLGALSHLVLDEIYSVDTRGVVPKFKKSFGTAVKFYGKKGWANFSTYAKLAVVALCIMAEPEVSKKLSETNPQFAGGVQSAHNAIQGIGNRVQQRFQQALSATAPPTMSAAAANGPNGIFTPAPQQQPAWGQPAQQYANTPQSALQQPALQQPTQQQLLLQQQQLQVQQQQVWGGFAPHNTQQAYGGPQPSYQQPGYAPPQQAPPANNFGGFAPSQPAPPAWGGPPNSVAQPPQQGFAPR